MSDSPMNIEQVICDIVVPSIYIITCSWNENNKLDFVLFYFMLI